MLSNETFVASVYGIAFMSLIAAGLHLHFKLNPSRRSRMTERQRQAEREAVRLLTQAQELMRKNDANVHKAMRLRFQVTHELLPQCRMYIVGKHPRSLLKNVDHLIQRAHMHRFRTNFDMEKEQPPKPKYPTLEEVQTMRGQRYGTVAQQELKKTFWYAIAMVGFILLLGLLILLMSQMGPHGAYQNAFQFLK